MVIHMDAIVVPLDRCPACGKESFTTMTAPSVAIGKAYFSALPVGLTRCLGCGLVSTNPRPSDEILGTFYDSPGYKCHSGTRESEWSGGFRLSLLRRGTLVDFGCGDGLLLKRARAAGWPTIIGVEPGIIARNQLMQEGIEVHGSCAELPQNQADCVTAIHVIEHIPNPLLTLRELRRLLKPNGILMVEVPNVNSARARIADSPLQRVLALNAVRYQAFPLHLHYFSARSLTLLLERGGFRVFQTLTVGLGVDELFTRPTRNGDGPPTSGNRKRRRSSTWLRTLVKRGVSAAKLGEHLIMLCSPELRT